MHEARIICVRTRVLPAPSQLEPYISCPVDLVTKSLAFPRSIPFIYPPPLPLLLRLILMRDIVASKAYLYRDAPHTVDKLSEPAAAEGQL